MLFGRVRKLCRYLCAERWNDENRHSQTGVWEREMFIHVLHNEQDYQQAVELLDNLIDIVGENENHPLASLMELLGLLIEQYEDTYVPEIAV
jgi:HTH-type transcriptional regulator/antitoxin HigA